MQPGASLAESPVDLLQEYHTSPPDRREDFRSFEVKQHKTVNPVKKVSRVGGFRPPTATDF
jgi:hypothetical protein